MMLLTESKWKKIFISNLKNGKLNQKERFHSISIEFISTKDYIEPEFSPDHNKIELASICFGDYWRKQSLILLFNNNI